MRFNHKFKKTRTIFSALDRSVTDEHFQNLQRAAVQSYHRSDYILISTPDVYINKALERGGG